MVETSKHAIIFNFNILARLLDIVEHSQLILVIIDNELTILLWSILKNFSFSAGASCAIPAAVAIVLGLRSSYANGITESTTVAAAAFACTGAMPNLKLLGVCGGSSTATVTAACSNGVISITVTSGAAPARQYTLATVANIYT